MAWRHPPPTRRGVRLGCLLAIALGSLGAAPPAQAQTRTQTARAHFESGQSLYDVGEFARALVEFKESFLASDDPVLLFNMAQCHRQLGQAAEAVRLYRSYLRRKPDAPNRPEVERRIEELRATAPAAPAPPPPGAAVPPAAIIETRPAVSPEESPPLYRRWWFWAAVAGVAAAGVTVALTAGRGTARPTCLAPYDCK
jgi:tetratricopeptide (TPR) repeat protein